MENLEGKPMDRSDIVKKIQEEEDYVRCPKLGNSLSKFLSKNPDGVENPIIARMLLMTEEEVEQIYQEAIQKLRLKMSDK